VKEEIISGRNGLDVDLRGRARDEMWRLHLKEATLNKKGAYGLNDPRPQNQDGLLSR
jgi:hypothetical protein